MRVNSKINNLPVTINGAIVLDKKISDLIEAFISTQDVKESSKETYRKALRQFIEWISEKSIESPNRETILTYKTELKAKGLSSLTLSGYITVVRKFFEWTEAMKYYPNIAKGVKGAKRTMGFKKDPLTVSQIKELLGAIDKSMLKGKRDYALINLLIRTGLRTVEAVKADVGDIRQQGGEALLWIQGKGRDDKDQFVLLTQETLRPIYKYLRTRDKGEKKDPLFASISDRNNGNRLTTRSVRRIIKERLKRIGIESERLTAHSLRHTAITLSLQAGATIQEAQALGRHSNINTTLIYAHNINRLKNAPERKIDKILLDISN